MSSIVFAGNKKNAPILQRIYKFSEDHKEDFKGLEDNIYLKYRYNVERRNFTLWLIPHMYVLAEGERILINELYAKAVFKKSDDYEIHDQVLSGTVRRNRRGITTLIDFITPNLYDAIIYGNHILSPFNRQNRSLYRFHQRLNTDSTTWLGFRPRHYNTQLVNGYAIVDTHTGRIIRTVLNGEFDMISFRTDIEQGTEGVRSLMPEHITTASIFKFMGNRISSVLEARYNSPVSLPDSIRGVKSRTLMDSIRPLPLTITDQNIYKKYDDDHRPDTTTNDTSGIVRSVEPKKKSLLRRFWSNLGDNLVTPIRAESEKASFRLSPILNPMYIGWSQSRGFRYKFRINTQFKFSMHRYLTFNPSVGYNFKLKQFYYSLPLRMVYNPKRNGYVECVFGNGNRISNNSVLREINRHHADTLKFDDDADKFDDRYLELFNNIQAYDWLDISTGIIYHRRRAINQELMIKHKMPIMFRSLAPVIGLKFSPWRDGPTISVDWEKTITGIHDTNIEYERWEIDASWKYRMKALRTLSLRGGAGWYTNKEQEYFVDFANFYDNNLPEGWDDEWSGNFQLLRSEAYNSSNYYIRANASYQSPMMIAVWIPYLGKYVENERFYLNTVFLERSRPYTELGYSFTNRYLSIGFFSSFKGSHFDRFGVEFEFELFRRW